MDYLIVAHLFGLLCHQELHDGASGLRHEGLVPSCERGDIQYMHIVLDGLIGSLCGVWKSGPISII